MAYIKFGLISKHLIFPFFPPVFACLRMYIITQIGNLKSQLIFLLFMFIGESFSGINELVLVYLKKEDTFNKANNDAQKVIKNKITLLQPKEERKGTIYLYFLLFAFIDSLTFYIVTAFSSQGAENNICLQTKVILIFYTGILSKFFLGYPIHRHQVLSLSIIIIIIGIMTSFQWLKIDVIELIVYIISNFFIAIQKILEKWVMLNKHISPYRLLFFEGCIGIVLTLIYSLPLYYIKCEGQWGICNKGKPIDNIVYAFILIFKEKPMHLLSIAGVILCSFMLNIFNVLTNYYLTPNHRAVSETLAACIWWIITAARFEHKESYDIVLSSIGYVVIAISSLVYNEIIILNFCTLKKNTMKEIGKRGDEENKIIAIETLVDESFASNEEER